MPKRTHVLHPAYADRWVTAGLLHTWFANRHCEIVHSGRATAHILVRTFASDWVGATKIRAYRHTRHSMASVPATSDPSNSNPVARKGTHKFSRTTHKVTVVTVGAPVAALAAKAE